MSGSEFSDWETENDSDEDDEPSVHRVRFWGTHFTSSDQYLSVKFANVAAVCALMLLFLRS